MCRAKHFRAVFNKAIIWVSTSIVAANNTIYLILKYSNAPKWRQKGAVMAEWWEHSPPTSVAQVQFPGSVSDVGWICCWFSSFSQEVFLWVLLFRLSSKTNIFKFQLDLVTVDEEPPSGRATVNFD